MGRSKPRFPNRCREATVQISGSEEPPPSTNDSLVVSGVNSKKARQQRFLWRRRQRIRFQGDDDDDNNNNNNNNDKDSGVEGGASRGGTQKSRSNSWRRDVVLGRLALAWDPSSAGRFAHYPQPPQPQSQQDTKPASTSSTRDQEEEEEEEEEETSCFSHNQSPHDYEAHREGDEPRIRDLSCHQPQTKKKRRQAITEEDDNHDDDDTNNGETAAVDTKSSQDDVDAEEEDQDQQDGGNPRIGGHEATTVAPSDCRRRRRHHQSAKRVLFQIDESVHHNNEQEEEELPSDNGENQESTTTTTDTSKTNTKTTTTTRISPKKKRGKRPRRSSTTSPSVSFSLESDEVLDQVLQKPSELQLVPLRMHQHEQQQIVLQYIIGAAAAVGGPQRAVNVRRQRIQPSKQQRLGSDSDGGDGDNHADDPLGFCIAEIPIHRCCVGNSATNGSNLIILTTRTTFDHGGNTNTDKTNQENNNNDWKDAKKPHLAPNSPRENVSINKNNSSSSHAHEPKPSDGILFLAGKSIVCLFETILPSAATAGQTPWHPYRHLAACVELGYMAARLIWLERADGSDDGDKKKSFTIPNKTTRIDVKHQPQQSAAPNGTMLSSSNESEAGGGGGGGGGEWMLHVFVLPQALQQCHARVLPLQRVAQAPKYRHAQWIHQALLDIHSITVTMATTTTNAVADDDMDSDTTVTAKQIYDWTDNVPLERVLQQQQQQQTTKQQSMNRRATNGNPRDFAQSIPGLRPILRPYQAMAVQWMLQRENNPTPLEEWKLAWVVLSSPPVCSPLPQPAEVATAPSSRHCSNGSFSRVSSFVPLKQWESYPSKDSEKLMLFCPVVGWLATSIDEARNMSLGTYLDDNDSDYDNQQTAMEGCSGVKGGILAESMGLGKTVEVLACILAHPRPQEQWANHGSNSVLSGPSSTPLQAHENGATSLVRGESNVGDVTEFGDADDGDDDSDADNGSVDRTRITTRNKSPALVSPEPANTSTTATDTDSSTAGSTESPVVATATTDTQERWLDEGETLLGSCVCGDVIHIEASTVQKPVVVCCQCKEPMHMDCAGFDTVSALKEVTHQITYRKMFSDKSWTCFETPRTMYQRYCPSCCAVDQQGHVLGSKLICSRATLIVTPPAILTQWEREIDRHAQNPDTKRPLKVATYHGVDKTTKSRPKRGHAVNKNGMKLLHPHFMADHDVILVTFDALLSDFGHASDENKFVLGQDEHNNGGWLRKRKRYRVVPSPLSAIDFWRICLDEAQRVERPTATSARMALKLHAQHRWCVTGTPVGRGQLQDLFGLLLFLRMSPFSQKAFFSKSLETVLPHRQHPIPMSYRIQALLADIFWRSTKAHPLVRQQMGVPEQTEVKHLLKFSSIERHFYERQLEATLATAGDFCERRRKGQQDKMQHLNLLAEHLHRLRAACCHPQVGAGGITSISNSHHHRNYGKKRRTAKRNNKNHAAASMATDSNSSSESGVSNVLTMEEILVRLIDDARLKCEESQRLVTMHTNGMAALSRLQVEAKERGEKFPQQRDDDESLVQSCKLYMESLDLAESNSRPTPVLANVTVSGSKGFRTANSRTQGGKAVQLNWKLLANSGDDGWPQQQSFWAKVDFEGPARRITRFKIRPIVQVPKSLQSEVADDFEWAVLIPKVCALEVSSPALGGEFVPVTKIVCPLNGTADKDDDGWFLPDQGFHTHKSKVWRILIESCHKRLAESTPVMAFYVGLELVLEEADISSDSLQTLHALHNASLSFASLIQWRQNREKKSGATQKDAGKVATRKTKHDEKEDFLSVDAMKQKMAVMSAKSRNIESIYTQVAKSLHTACKQKLIHASEARRKSEMSFFELGPSLTKKSRRDCWDAGWWDEFLVACSLYGEELQAHGVCVRVQEELDHIQSKATADSAVIKFPSFRDIRGLQMALHSRLNAIRTSGIGKATSWVNTMEDGIFQIRKDRFKCQPGMHAKCMDEIKHLSPTPSQQELYANSHCHVCKADWYQQGPKCRHCVIGDQLNELEPDRVTILLMNTLHGVLRGPIGTSIIKRVAENTGDVPNWLDRAKTFFDVLEAQKREKVLAWRQWRTHLDLLNDLDELNQCKESIRLAYDGENLTELTAEQQNAVVLPCAVLTQYHDHAAKQAMALGDLRRARETLRYLRNQQVEQETHVQSQQIENDKEKTEGTETCVVCLNPFGSTDRAVLRCGHSYHASPCLERLKSRTKSITCPMRCRISTSVEQVLIASNKRRDDGSGVQRHDVKGSWGTKVTQVVADLLDVRDLGEKAILFSQWEDMLDIVAQALAGNTVLFVRASSRAKIGEALAAFRTNENCTVLMLNVKHGAEGLTIVEARHVFMLEPLLNPALDVQAVNRVWRIGQTHQTTVHRYIVRDTVEVKIDALRLASADDSAVVEDTKAAKPTIRAGGVDGGFASEEELMQLLTLNKD